MGDEAPLKAKLKVTLKADDVVVAEVENPTLWHNVLLAIQTGTNAVGAALQTPLATPPPANPSDALGKLAAELGLGREIAQGALSPQADAPYMHLNQHNWESMRKALPERGPKALSPMAAGATLMALWFRHAGLGNVTQAQVLTVLGGINVEDKNPSRGIRNSKWLSPRAGGQVVLNPAEISIAMKVAKAFCTKNWKDWLSGPEQVTSDAG